MRTADGVREIEGQSTSGKLDVVVGGCRNVAHLTV